MVLQLVIVSEEVELEIISADVSFVTSDIFAFSSTVSSIFEPLGLVFGNQLEVHVSRWSIIYLLESHIVMKNPKFIVLSSKVAFFPDV